MDRPKTLYKYRSLSPDFAKSYVSTILRQSKIYLSYASQFNDPFECQADVLIDKDDPLVAGSSRLQILESARANLRNMIQIYSMSAANNHMLLWSHYADSHRGVCLGFDAESQDEVFSVAEPVVYKDALPVLDLRKDQDPLSSAKTVALTKGTRWFYEEEWRLVTFQSERELTFSPKALTEVILGCDISNKDRLAITAALLTRESPVQLYQAHRNALRYSVEVIPRGRISLECLRDENILDPVDILKEGSK